MRPRGWRKIECSLDATCGPEYGPRTPVGGIKRGPDGTYLQEPDSAGVAGSKDMPHGNRGSRMGSACYGWRDHYGRFTWTNGPAPAKVGVVCSEDWSPVAPDELPLLVQPFGGFHRSQVAAQRGAAI